MFVQMIAILTKGWIMIYGKVTGRDRSHTLELVYTSSAIYIMGRSTNTLEVPGFGKVLRLEFRRTALI